MKLLFFFIAFIPVITVYGQRTMPGGVRGASVWQITESTQQGEGRWKSNLENPLDTVFIAKGKIKTINNNPALLFTQGQNTLNSTVNLGNLAAFSLFTVSQEIDTLSEKVIFSLENDTAAEMVLTSQRMAALDIYRYANYNLNMKQYPKIYSYLQNKTNDQGTVSRRLQFGRPPRNQSLPVSSYNGIVPEVILFFRSISPMERQKVESYLALKYGISLNQEFPLSYLNSIGEIIWDAEINPAYSLNIAGIGRDDLSGLNQKVSESTQTPGVMKIGVAGELKNNSFLIWGDNGKPLRISEENGMRKLQRDWKLSAFNFADGPIFFETNELSFNEIDPLHQGEIYWLMVDRSGTGKYPFRQTGFFQCLPMSPSGGLIKFSPVAIDKDRSGYDVFTLLAAPAFFTRSIVRPPSCSSAQSGAIQIDIAGGVPPFDLTLKSVSNSSLPASSRVFERDYVFEGIGQGAYVIQVTDADNKIFTERLWVSNTNLWESKINRTYKLVEGETLLLNAAEGMPAIDYSYSWTMPDGSFVDQEEIRINQPGNYLLCITDNNNCNSTREIKVIQTGRSGFRNTELFPNPVRGWFALRISLERKMDVNVVISDMAGKVLKQTMLKNDLYYLYNDIIQKPGIYYITLVAESEKQTLKLIVQ